jgi:hypothetical protein
MSRQRILPLLAVAVLAASFSVNFVHADDDSEQGSRAKYSGENRGKPLQPKQSNTLFQQECSSCHLAYAPGLLPAASWRKMMAGLDKHFGSDASLDARDNKEITDFLVKHSSNRWSAATAPLRITESAWFKRKHDAHEIDPAVWNNPQVKSPANCAACHPQAERGNFNDDDIKIPK